MHRRVAIVLCALAAVAAASPFTSSALAAETIVVTQQGRAFNPASVEISAGDRVRVVNDDGDLLHHAYVDNPELKFDSGEQEPGTSLEIAFPVAGTFDVLCGIHPKMRLVVTVR